MTDSHAEDEYTRHRAEAIDSHARDIDRLCAARLKSLTERLSSEQQPYPRGHLTTLRRPIHFLALQAIDPNGHPSMHPQAGGLTAPYRDRLALYFRAAEDINAVIERAVASGELVVRNASTGIPMPALPARTSEPAKPFCVAILNAEALRTHVFHDAAELLLGLPLLDHLPHEGVAVRLAEFDEWAARAGIAEAGEITRLLVEADDRMWERELAWHAELGRLSQDEQAEAAARDADIETAADELKRLRANARARGRITDEDSDPTPEQNADSAPPAAHDVASAASADATNGEEWKTKARDIAAEYIKRHKESDLFPSMDNVCEHVEKKLRDSEIYGSQNRPLSASYIKRNAIQGEWWQRNKR